MQGPSSPPCLCPPPPPPMSCASPPADDAVLLTAFRDSLQQNFGDHGLGSALASLQGELSCAVLPALLFSVFELANRSLPLVAVCGPTRCLTTLPAAPLPVQSSTTIPCPTCAWCAAAGTSTAR